LLLKQHHPPPFTRALSVVTHSATPHAGGRLAQFGPALLGATSFACGDVLSKIVLVAGADALTASLARGVMGVALLFAWLRFAPRPAPFAPRARVISLGLGVLFAGNIFLLFKAFETVEVPIAVLTYFVYPLLTGLAGAATGLDKVTWRGAVTALVAFLGLSLMIGAHPTALATTGILAALGAALCRVGLLLVTRALLSDADPLGITWYSLLSSSALLAVAALATLNWQPPSGASGWLALLALSVAVTTGLIGVFGSTVRIGPFRTALFMNLEPLLATVGSALFLGEVVTPLQAFGGAVMIAALVVFQLRR
jgi:drug/metabolite transporter (DMT)-like permease